MRFIHLLLVVLFQNAVSAQVPNYVPTDGLMAWWPFNGNANDASGNGNHGTSNNAVLTIDRNGNANSAYNFNGIDQLITGSISGVTNTMNTTVSAWVRYTGNAGGQPYDTYFQLGTYGSHTLAYAYNYGAQNLDIYSFCTTGPAYPSTNLNNAWHHIAVVDSELGTTIYIDGQVLTSTSGGPSGNCYQGTSAFSIGSCNSTTDIQFVTGDLDDLGFWNRALTQTEVEALYSGEALSPCVSTTSISLSGLNTSYHTSDAPAELIGSPTGGVFFGPGVSGSQFDPAVAGPGNHTIVYTYVDQDGCIGSTGLCTLVSEGMGINDPDWISGGVRVFPNPTEGTFTLELELEGMVSLTVNNLNGKHVLSQTFLAKGAKTTRSIDLSKEAAGTYSLRISTTEGSTSQRLIRR